MCSSDLGGGDAGSGVCSAVGRGAGVDCCGEVGGESAGDLRVDGEPCGLVLAHRLGVAVFGVRDTVHPRRVVQRGGVVPADGDAVETEVGEERCDVQAGASAIC